MHLSSLGATWENSLGNSLSQILLLLNKSLHVSLILSSCFIMQFVSALNCHCVWNMLYKYIALPVGYIANNDFLSFCQFPTFFFYSMGIFILAMHTAQGLIQEHKPFQFSRLLIWNAFLCWDWTKPVGSVVFLY